MAETKKPAAPGKDAPPYFDVLFTRLENNDPFTREAFGRHVHWGLWPDPAKASLTPADYAEAAERLCHRVCDAAGVRDGLRILDVGCGFGGTIASLNERFKNLDLVGVNIDKRQLDRAQQQIKPQNGNRIRWVEADACQLPLPDQSFDVVLAVECIFHFPSRARFIAEAGRVLVNGGRMALSDFVPTEKGLPLLQYFNTASDETTKHSYGHIDVLCPLRTYKELAKVAGLALVKDEDINAQTLPTYTFLRDSVKTWDDQAAAGRFDQATAQIETACRAKMLLYTVLSFQKRAAEALKQSA